MAEEQVSVDNEKDVSNEVESGDNTGENSDTPLATDDTTSTDVGVTSSNADTAIDVSDYGIFNDAVSTVDTLKSDFETHNTSLKEDCTKLKSEDTFMGPICDECVKGFSNIDSKIVSEIDAFGKTHTLLVDAAASYDGTDQSVASLILGGSTQATSMMELGDRANNGDSAAQKEWLDNMAALVKPYCEKYGFPESVLLAQIIQESGWTKSSSWLNQNNNILNVNSEMWGSNDYKVSKDGVVNENADIPKWASNPKHASGPVSGGAYFESPREDSMRAYDSVEDCVEDYLALMVGYRPDLNGSDVDGAIAGIKHYAEDANYENALRGAIERYNLTQYDV